MKVICSIPGAQPGVINGQEFERDASGSLVSVGEVSEANLELFASVPGYSVETPEAYEARLKATEAATTKTKKAGAAGAAGAAGGEGAGGAK